MASQQPYTNDQYQHAPGPGPTYATSPQQPQTQFYPDQQQQILQQSQPYDHQQQQSQPYDHQQQQKYQQSSPQVLHQQPHTAAPMQHQPQPQHPGAGGDRPWENGMCSCFDDMSICCMGYWCPCVVFGKIQHRVRNPTMDNFSSCNGACWGWTALSCCGVQWVMSMIQRGDIRAKYRLDGSSCGDYSRHYWCGCCTLIQEDKETALRKSQETNTAGYSQQATMAYPNQK